MNKTEQLHQIMKDAARNVRARDPSLRGPFVITDEELDATIERLGIEPPKAPEITTVRALEIVLSRVRMHHTIADHLRAALSCERDAAQRNGQPDRPKAYIVWNQAKTEGFVTTDKQLAYEARKGSDTNCYTPEGECSCLALAFCEVTMDEDCTAQEVALDDMGEIEWV